MNETDSREEVTLWSHPGEICEEIRGRLEERGCRVRVVLSGGVEPIVYYRGFFSIGLLDIGLRFYNIR